MVSKSEWLEREATGIGSGNDCTSGKITRALSLNLSLEIAADSITAVSFDSTFMDRIGSPKPDEKAYGG